MLFIKKGMSGIVNNVFVLKHLFNSILSVTFWHLASLFKFQWMWFCWIKDHNVLNSSKVCIIGIEKCHVLGFWLSWHFDEVSWEPLVDSWLQQINWGMTQPLSSFNDWKCNKYDTSNIQRKCIKLFYLSFLRVDNAGMQTRKSIPSVLCDIRVVEI